MRVSALAAVAAIVWAVGCDGGAREAATSAPETAASNAAPATASGAPGATPSEKRLPDILLITVDTLRPDHLGIYGYERDTSPNIDRWFGEGAIFERAYTTEANTPPSIVSVLSGLYPREHRVRLFYQLVPKETALLPDLLPDTYQAAAFLSSPVLTDEALGIAERFDAYDDFVDEKEPFRPVFERGARRTTDAALAWLAESRDPDRPLFLWIHYIDPHGPYLPPDDATVAFEHEGSVPMELERMHAYQHEPGVTDALHYVDGYDAEIAYMDAHLGRLLEGYAARFDAERALMVFTADHGESMLEHERWFTHGYHVYDEIVRVPLLARGPGITPGRRPSIVSIVDVAPTLLGAVGVPPPERLSGRDLRAPPADAGSPRTVFAEGGAEGLITAAIRPDGKWILLVERGESEPIGGHAFDLANDPRELAPTPLPELDSEPLRTLIERARKDPDPGGQPESAVRGARLAAPKISPRADAAALERLRALGYVE